MDTNSKNDSQNEWRTGWVVVMAAFFLVLVTDGLVMAFGILLIDLVDYFNEDRAFIALIGAIHFAVMCFTGPFAGALCNRFGARVTVVTGSVMSSAGLVLCSFATSIYHLWIAYGLVSGIGFGLMYTTANLCVLQHFDKHRALANGIAISGSGIGTFVFNYSMRLLLEHYGWKGTMLLQAGMLLQGVVLAFLLSGPNHKYTRLEKAKETLVAGLKSFATSILKKELLTDVRCIVFFLSAFFIALTLMVPYTFIPDQVVQTGMTKTEAAILTASIGIANTVSRVIFGWLGDRVCFSRLFLLIGVLLLNGLMTGVSPFMITFETKLIYTCCFGAFIGAVITLLYVVIADIVTPDLLPSAFGVLLMIFGIGIAAATPFAGFLFDITGSYTITFIICGVDYILAAGCMLICYCVRKEDCRQLEHTNLLMPVVQGGT